MQKKLISSVHIDNPRIDIWYYLVREKDRFGIQIRKSDGKESTRMLVRDEEAVHNFILRIAEGAIHPDFLDDVSDDFLYEFSLA